MPTIHAVHAIGRVLLKPMTQGAMMKSAPMSAISPSGTIRSGRMSDTTASLRRKIGSAGNLQSVVRTMKALAASSIGQYEKSVLALADYYRAVELGLGPMGAPAN